MFAAGKTKGASNGSSSANYIEDVFSTYLYTGTGSTQTINNGIDLATKGGLVWFKSRSGAYNHALIDTARGGGQVLSSNTTSAQADYSPQGISAFNTNGFTFGTTTAELNNSSNTYTSWSFAKTPKFFDVVTYTGTASAQNIAHNLGSTPACIIVKKTNDTSIWPVYHASLGGADKFLLLNATDAVDSAASLWNNTAPTSTQFTVGTSGSTNGSGNTFVAYLFASNAGGFGLTGTDNVISCGSFTTDSSQNATVNLGYEPQFILYKSTSYADNWYTIDNMRGWSVGNGVNYVSPNLSAAEANYSAGGNPTATGFQINTGNPNSTYIYIAIRRGPMKVPTDATKVYTSTTGTGTGSASTPEFVSGFPVDFAMFGNPTTSASLWRQIDRLRGAVFLDSSTTGAESAGSNFTFDYSTGYYKYAIGSGYRSWMFRRAPSFFDEVCYTGTYPTVSTQTHNLGVAPELMIVKRRDSTSQWSVYSLAWLNSLGLRNRYGVLNATDSLYATDTDIWNNTLATSSSFQVNANATNANGGTFVAYLFATCAGVSKCGLYTGNGTTQTINCGFTGGARFVLIKRADSTGDWYVYDTARGMTVLTDPYLLLNSTAAESVTLGSVTTVSTGFAVNASILAAINTNGASYIYLSIA